MNARTWAAVILLLAGASHARAQAGGAAGTNPPASATKKSERDAAAKKKAGSSDSKSAAADAAKPSPKAKLGARSREEKPPVDSAARNLARRTRSVFVFAVDSCGSERAHCDASLRDDAERRFMDACGACTTFERCDVDRKAIRAGSARSSADPCGP